MEKIKNFLEKAYNTHMDKYDYSLVEYINSITKIKIICKIHGVFEQEPAAHIRGQGCPYCAGVKRNTKEIFIKRANEIHNNIYDYSLVEYINNKTKVKIICSEHGVFINRPDNHINKKSGCPICANNQLYTKEIFIEKANKIHNNKYDYSLVDYKTAHDKIKIICKNHGVFEQEPCSHLLGSGCKECSNEKISKERKGKIIYKKPARNLDDFIKLANNVHNNKYDYSLVEYITSAKKIKIICPIHDVFEQEANAHLCGHGCSKCYSDERTYDTNKFIELSIKKHGNKYDYSLVDYKHSREKVKIICPIHGIFEQISYRHILGNGCPICKSSRGETEIKNILDNMNILYEYQKIFSDCKDERYLPFDFYLPDYNLCIEYDGLQHFKPIEYFGGEKTLLITQKHDNIKNKYCKNNNIKLIRIRYNQKVEELLKFENF